MKALIFAALICSFLSSFVCFESDREWSLFKKTYSKSYYNSNEERFRYKVYLDNKRYIEEHNARAAKNIHSFTLAMNRFGDLTSQEFNKRMNGYNRKFKSPLSKGINYTGQSMSSPPNFVDWRTKGYVTQVKDQGECGSCWAFSSTGSLEGQLFRFTGKKELLSEQNLVDCSLSFGNFGCSGGLMSNAFTYIAANKGIDGNRTYPYTAKDGTCKYKKLDALANDAGFVSLPSGNEKFLKQAVAAVGPISVAIDASFESFHFYREGIYDEVKCSQDQLDHAVLVVGYGTDRTNRSYWLVKNSWGESWGEEGYIRMSRNLHNQCGIATEAVYPILTEVPK